LNVTLSEDDLSDRSTFAGAFAVKRR
jgi:hypothetical protein